MENDTKELCLVGFPNPHARPVEEIAETSISPLHRCLERHDEVDVTFFIACYNEEKNIIPTLETLRMTLEETDFSYEVIVIDDCSRDRSTAQVEDYQRQHPDVSLRLVRNVKNRGLSRNFVEGAFLGRGRYYKLVCGDNVETRENFLAVFEHLGKVDVVVPYHAENKSRGWFRTLLSRSYTRCVNLVGGYSLRYYNGCALYRRADVMRWHSRSSGFGFQADLMIRLLDEGVSYVEVPIVCLDRQEGSSSALKLRNWFSVGRTLLRLLVRRR